MADRQKRWYPIDPHATVEQSHAGPRFIDAREAEAIDALRTWLLSKDPREPMGAIVLAQYPDGFAVQYLGAEWIDALELVRRVVWIGDSLREASG
jgi:hypothetical protein